MTCFKYGTQAYSCITSLIRFQRLPLWRGFRRSILALALSLGLLCCGSEPCGAGPQRRPLWQTTRCLKDVGRGSLVADVYSSGSGLGLREPRTTYSRHVNPQSLTTCRSRHTFIHASIHPYADGYTHTSIQVHTSIHRYIHIQIDTATHPHIISIHA